MQILLWGLHLPVVLLIQILCLELPLMHQILIIDILPALKNGDSYGVQATIA